ncbi:hypothetical protein BDY19DRAFT_1002499 [Irpex rosettiformis]|uniref:Uncharacterized protein n=1 Tax=Irpex rosettiformis TaxID=378272 RepID=A0ACB8ULJ4_9APHY|nr:hypothetical protein BDY19DRAFT_1002499 [Irpex rosettiformis]
MSTMKWPTLLSIVSDPSLSFSYLDALTIGKRFRTAAVSLLIYDHRRAHMEKEQETSRILSIHLLSTLGATEAARPDRKNICVIYLTLDAIVWYPSEQDKPAHHSQIYALYERNKRILVILLALCTLEALTMGALVAIIMTRLFHTSVGCAYEQLPETAFLLFLPGLLYEPVLCGLVAYKAWAVDIRIPMIRRIARDRVFIELLASALVWAFAPRWMNIVNPWSAALPSLLGSRLILNMREAVVDQSLSTSYILEQFSSDPPGTDPDIELVVQVPIPTDTPISSATQVS